MEKHRIADHLVKR